MKNNYFIAFASIFALFMSTSVVLAETVDGGVGGALPTSPPVVDHPMQVRGTLPGEMPMDDQNKPQPMLMDSGSSEGNEGGMEMKNPPVGGGTMTKEEMENARPMEKHIDEHGNMPMNGDNMMMPRGDGMEMGEYKDVDLDIDVDELMAQEAKEDHTGEVEIDEASEVRSGDDFEHFVAHKSKADANIKSVGVKSGKVEMTYAMPVKFLGFWGTTLDTRMSADTSGDVSFDYPWYAIFMKKDFSKKTVEPILKAEINSEKIAVTTAGMKGTTTMPMMKHAFATPHVFEAMLQVASKVKASWNLKENVK